MARQRIYKELAFDPARISRAFRCDDGHRFTATTARKIIRCQHSGCRLRAHQET